MPKVIKVLASKTSGIDIYADDGKIYPFMYSPEDIEDFINSVEKHEDVYPWEEDEISSGKHLEVAEAEDMEVLWEEGQN